ncbi:MAG TPA: acyl-CoA dehydrogenase family protein [Gemmatimonadaceae bacterium]|nr:acyl-CoA dehydrogenase family protein [Gemmatimonadaceae bacterium]
MDEHLRWPFFEHRHHELARDLRLWAERQFSAASTAGAGNVLGGALRAPAAQTDVDAMCRELAKQLGARGWLKYCIPRSHGGAEDKLDVRSLCLCRETLAEFEPLADFVFAMQGLGAGPISMFGTDAQKGRYLPGVGRGEKIAAFALSEPSAGSDVTAMQTTARRQSGGWVLDGEKTFISNAGIADFYIVFARLPDERDRAFGAFVVEATARGLDISERIETLSPHPLGTVTLASCVVGDDSVVGPHGKGLRVALGTLDVFRSTVAAAALGFARRAMREAITHAKARNVFGKALAEHQITQAKIAEMAMAIDASALLVYRAAWTRDTVSDRVTREAAMAKLFATEAAQRVIDDAVQLLGGRGVVAGSPVERLYREIRSLRIYEGTSEVQRLVIAGEVLGA